LDSTDLDNSVIERYVLVNKNNCVNHTVLFLECINVTCVDTRPFKINSPYVSEHYRQYVK